MEEHTQRTSASNEKSVDLTSVITTALKIPGVKVSRETFLREQFKDLSPDVIALIVKNGPVDAGCSREDLSKKATRIVKERAALSTGVSFLAGMPGGWAMAATIPADLLQFYGVALRMAQELVYLYGESDMWCDGTPDADKVYKQLILYCGVMLGASGAAQTARVMSSALAKQAVKKLPQKALTKTFYYPVIKSIMRFFGVSVTKSTFAKGVAKVLPVIGGVVSGGITLASMVPMGNRLITTLDKAHFDYTETDLDADIRIISDVCENEENYEDKARDVTADEVNPENTAPDKSDMFNQVKQAKQMLDNGLITEDEYSAIKEKVISRM